MLRHIDEAPLHLIPVANGRQPIGRLLRIGHQFDAATTEPIAFPAASSFGSGQAPIDHQHLGREFSAAFYNEEDRVEVVGGQRYELSEGHRYLQR